MIKFDKLEVTRGGRFLTLKVSIEDTTGTVYNNTTLDYDWFENVYLDLILIDTDKTYSDLGSEGKLKKIIFTATLNLKEYETVIDLEGFEDRMIFVEVRTKGEPTADTPCGIKNPRTRIKVTFDKALLYNLIMKYLKNVGETGCDYNTKFYDFLLKWHAFMLSLKAEKFNWAINYWNKFFSNASSVSGSSCNCGS